MTMAYSTREDVQRARFSGERAMPPAERQEQQPQHRFQNVGEGERWTALASGAILAAIGLARNDKVGYTLAGIAGALLYRGASGNCPIYSALGINNNQNATPQQRLNRRGVAVTQTFTINKSPEECYRFWRDFTNLPRIMTHLERVTDMGDGRKSHWVVKAPAIVGGTVEWDAEITDDQPNQRIAWRSLEGSDVDNAGAVSFEQSPRGTVARVEMRYVTPAGRIGSWISTLLGENPDRVIREDLRNFKRIMEIGELLTLTGQPRGTCTRHGMPHAEKNSYMPPPGVTR